MCLSTAYSALLPADYLSTSRDSGRYPKMTDAFLSSFVAKIGETTLEGMTGQIRFGTTIGQNAGGRLDYAQFDERENRWRVVPYTELLSHAARASASAAPAPK